MAKSSVINSTTNSANKSWVELCDEALDNSSDSLANGSDKVGSNVSGIEVGIEAKENCSALKEKPETGQDTPPKVKPDCSKSEARSGTKIKLQVENGTEGVQNENNTSPWNFSYATILKNSASKNNITPAPKSGSKQDDVKVENLESQTEKPTRGAKREIQREFLQEDISLSSHLDVFHMESPLKKDAVDEEMASPVKMDGEKRSAKKRLCQAKLPLEEEAVLPDDVLMPSPQKVTRLSSRRKREPGESPLTNKRSRHSSAKYNTPKCVVPVEPPTEELETDEQVLIRRQKQIDYGKNTIGYDRYCQMIPKLKRHRKHPQTPPKHIKYSRRAWDGLVKQWRQQLHFWDPPSEGGGNFDDLDMSSISGASSDSASVASSLPATPRDKSKPKRYSRTRATRSSESSHGTAEDSGCSPLK